MTISFINGAPALLIKRERMLVVSDLHIGLEFKFRENGVFFPNASLKMAEQLLALCKKSKVKRIAILGDVKERITNVTGEEERAMKQFFDVLSGIEIRIAKGNHDAYLDRILSKLGFKIPVEKEILLSKTALLHGNVLPSEEAMEKDYVVAGHGHVTAEVNGSFEKVWVMANVGKGAQDSYKNFNKNAKLVLVPAFNSMITGSRFGDQSKSHLPLFRREVFDIETAKVYSLDGVELGG